MRVASLVAPFDEKAESMDKLVEEYLKRADEIVGERTPEEILHDNAVVAALNNGRPIREALASAGDKYPEERMQWDETMIADIAAHYEYLQEHMRIMEKLRKRGA